MGHNNSLIIKGQRPIIAAWRYA